jgi:hypothetical protein
MIWTYRVLRDKMGRYSIREVFYERDGTVIGYGKQPAVAVDTSLEELVRLVDWFKDAFDLPILSTEEMDAQIAAQPTHRRTEPGENIPLNQVIAELEAEAELVKE